MREKWIRVETASRKMGVKVDSELFIILKSG